MTRNTSLSMLSSNVFRHVRVPVADETMKRTETTSTGAMLAAPFLPESISKPQPAPLPFISKTDMNYKKTNRFSDHDNRHAFQDNGVYFGDGRNSRLLGRRLLGTDKRLHFTESDFLRHRTIRPIHVDKDSLYTSSYFGEPTAEPPVHRRFPRSYSGPQKGPIPLDTTTTDWFQRPPAPFRTPLHVLAVSQEPFLAHNPWKYSNNSLRKVYPPYDRKCDTNMDSTFNRYGAAFLPGSSSAHPRLSRTNSDRCL